MPYVEARAGISPKQPEAINSGLGSNGLFFRLEVLINQRRLLTLQEWRNWYMRSCRARGLTPDDARDRYDGLHNSLALEIKNGSEEADLEFLRRELSGLTLEDRGTSAFRLYRLGVVCFRKPKPGSEEIMEKWGRALHQAAFKRYPNPQFARGAVIELTVKSQDRMRQRRRERRKKLRGENPKDPQLFHPFNSREVFEMFTPQYYRSELAKWQDILAELSESEEIDWQFYEAEYRKLVAASVKLRDTRVYDKIRFYDHKDYEKFVEEKDEEAILKGLSAMHTTRDTRESEIPGYKLLTDIAFNSLPPRIITKPPRPWKAFVAYVVKQEIVRKLGEVTTNPSAEITDANDRIQRARGPVKIDSTIKNLEQGQDVKLPF